MKRQRNKIWLSARDTTNWANRPSALWPCSTIAGHRLFAEFDKDGNLLDYTIDGRNDQHTDAIDVTEFNAITDDFRYATED